MASELNVSFDSSQEYSPLIDVDVDVNVDLNEEEQLLKTALINFAKVKVEPKYKENSKKILK